MSKKTEPSKYKKGISVYGLEGLKGNRLTFKMSAQQETGQAKLWLKQTSNRNLVPVKGLSILGDAKRDESGILLGKEAGIKTLDHIFQHRQAFIR